jgi:hypothetical protein
MVLRGIRASLVGVALIGALFATPASAATRTVIARGPCSGDSRWALVLVKDGGAIHVGYRVVSGVSGETWRVRVLHNRRVIFRGLQVTHGDHGAFGFRLLTRNLEGPDVIRARARNLSTDELCRGRAVI